MTLRYTLTENDFLQHLLFSASQTDRIKQQRTRTWLIYSAALLLFSLIFYQNGSPVMTYYFLITGIAFFCFFPFYQRRYYKKHYQNYVTDTYKNRFGQPVNINFNETCIETSDFSGESKINLTEIENATETGEYFYLKMRTGGHLIIPKQKIDNIDSVRQELKQLCSKLSVAFLDNLEWRWK